MAGRKKLEFSEKEIEQMKVLAQAGCTMEEMAAFMGCHRDTLSTHFSDLIAKERETGCGKLRVAQMKSALNGNTSMLKWLGNNRLFQATIVKHELTGNVKLSPDAQGIVEKFDKLEKEWT